MKYRITQALAILLASLCSFPSVAHAKASIWQYTLGQGRQINHYVCSNYYDTEVRLQSMQKFSTTRWDGANQQEYWLSPRGGRVTYDGVTYRNVTSYPAVITVTCY